MARGVNWIAVRTAYVVKGWTSEKCAREFGVDPTTIRKRASKEGWTEERTRCATNATLAATEEARAAVREVTTSHVEAAENLLRLTRIAADKLEQQSADVTNLSSLRSFVEAGRALSEWADRAMTASRLAQGMRPGDKSAPDAIDDGPQMLPTRKIIGRPEGDTLKAESA